MPPRHHTQYVFRICWPVSSSAGPNGATPPAPPPTTDPPQSLLECDSLDGAQHRFEHQACRSSHLPCAPDRCCCSIRRLRWCLRARRNITVRRADVLRAAARAVLLGSADARRRRPRRCMDGAPPLLVLRHARAALRRARPLRRAGLRLRRASRVRRRCLLFRCRGWPWCFCCHLRLRLACLLRRRERRNRWPWWRLHHGEPHLEPALVLVELCATGRIVNLKRERDKQLPVCSRGRDE